MCIGGGGGDSFLQEEYERQGAEEAARQGRITAGKANIDNAFAGYDDAFYAGQAQNYMDYATPQIEDQYTDAMRSLTRALARNGTSQSSMAAERKGDMERKLADAQTDAARQGQSFANDTRQSLASVKNNLISQNQSLADPTLISNMAANQSAAASQLPSYSPVANLFAGAAAGLATQSQLEARDKARYNMAELFSLNGGSARKIN
tara:strand:+ start:1418 stop:2035 length:618 start_codon:yes stop_codon:yes gene_type:complete